MLTASGSKVVLLVYGLRSRIRTIHHERNVKALEVVDHNRDVLEHLHTDVDRYLGGGVDVGLGVATDAILLLDDYYAHSFVFETNRRVCAR